ncbi:S8 family serine peptidase [Neobacillus sp. SCS-31]|uniref:S8 family serine peptidase n=1 Tax=Neobacillus oceani TaxID=3115292 RepID=UPI0039057721
MTKVPINNNFDELMKTTEKYVEPNWRRLGFDTTPDVNTSGKGVGIVIIDDIQPHNLIDHLGDRLKQVKVDDDFNISCLNVSLNQPKPLEKSKEHGLMSLLLLAHKPLIVGDHYHVGLAPAATFIMLSEVEPKKVEKGLNWILKKRNEWNIQIVLNLFVPNTREIGSIKHTINDPFVRALEPAFRSGLLIVAANGNSRTHNNLHPIHFFTVGGYNDNGVSCSKKHFSHPAVPWGRNGDGHFRPDILAPFTYLSVPYCEKKDSKRLLSYFGGSCGSATLVAGVCAYFLSTYPQINNNTLRSALVQNATFYHNDIPVPRIDIGKVKQFLTDDYNIPEIVPFSARIDIKNPSESLSSKDPVQRASALTELIENKMINRETLWSYLDDESPIVRKTIISYGLGAPRGENERALYWNYFNTSIKESGEKISWLYQLLKDSKEDELDRWIELLMELDIEIVLCVKIFLEKHYKDSPEIHFFPDPSDDFIKKMTSDVLGWYKEYKGKKHD